MSTLRNLEELTFLACPRFMKRNGSTI